MHLEECLGGLHLRMDRFTPMQGKESGHNQRRWGCLLAEFYKDSVRYCDVKSLELGTTKVC